METQKVEFIFKVEIDKIEFCLVPEKKNRPSFVDISPTLVIDTSMERSSSTTGYSMETQKVDFFSKKFEID